MLLNKYYCSGVVMEHTFLFHLLNKLAHINFCYIAEEDSITIEIRCCNFEMV